VNERVNALADKVEMIGPSLVIENFEFDDPLEEKFVGKFELWLRNLALVEYPDSNDQLAVVSVVSFREYSIE